ncbi:MAG: aminomethyl-transferring glycine dehydrogenase subunit GcvPB, partial [bacterium]
DSLPDELYRDDKPDLPQVKEPQVVRHFHNLSRDSFGVDTGPYLLGSCTMKYNPKLNEDLAALPGYLNSHPRQPLDQMEGWLELMGQLHDHLSTLTALPTVSLLPAAGAQGEWVALRAIGEYFEEQGETQRTDVLVPDTAHGTNPASASIAGFDVVEIESNNRGRVSLDDLRSKVNESTAALMLTNPNTLGLFEEDILEIKEIVHDAGGRLYYDGANLNALVGRIRPGSMGFDVVHMNLHKTFTTPHGAGGPGSGPVAFTDELAPYRPVPRLTKNGSDWTIEESSDQSLGEIRSYYGNMGILVRALGYIQRMGEKGLAQVSKDAVMASNYLFENMPEEFERVYEGPCKHEFVVTCDNLPVDAEDVAKRLIDYGIHPPTIHWPVKNCLMIEPTETLSRNELDEILDAFDEIVQEAIDDPERFENAPHTTRISRPDEAEAARDPVLNWTDSATS